MSQSPLEQYPAVELLSQKAPSAREVLAGHSPWIPSHVASAAQGSGPFASLARQTVPWGLSCAASQHARDSPAAAAAAHGSGITKHEPTSEPDDSTSAEISARLQLENALESNVVIPDMTDDPEAQPFPPAASSSCCAPKLCPISCAITKDEP